MIMSLAGIMEAEMRDGVRLKWSLYVRVGNLVVGGNTWKMNRDIVIYIWSMKD